MQRAFTFIEIVLVVGLISILMLLATNVVPNLFSQTRMDEAAATIESAIEAARSRAFQTASAGQAGVRFSETDYTLFIGPAFDTDPATRETVVYPVYLTVPSALFGASPDLVWNRATRRLEQAGTINLLLEDGRERTITIDIFGIIHAS